MQGYAGSVAWNGDGHRGRRSPRPRAAGSSGSTRRGASSGSVARPEVCGVAPLGPGFLLSDGLGGLVAVEDGVAWPLGRAEVAWDNHLVAI